MALILLLMGSVCISCKDSTPTDQPSIKLRDHQEFEIKHSVDSLLVVLDSTSKAKKFQEAKELIKHIAAAIPKDTSASENTIMGWYYDTLDMVQSDDELWRETYTSFAKSYANRKAPDSILLMEMNFNAADAVSQSGHYAMAQNFYLKNAKQIYSQINKEILSEEDLQYLKSGRIAVLNLEFRLHDILENFDGFTNELAHIKSSIELHPETQFIKSQSFDLITKIFQKELLSGKLREADLSLKMMENLQDKNNFSDQITYKYSQLKLHAANNNLALALAELDNMISIYNNYESEVNTVDHRVATNYVQIAHEKIYDLTQQVDANNMHLEDLLSKAQYYSQKYPETSISNTNGILQRRVNRYIDLGKLAKADSLLVAYKKNAKLWNDLNHLENIKVLEQKLNLSKKDLQGAIHSIKPWLTADSTSLVINDLNKVKRILKVVQHFQESPFHEQTANAHRQLLNNAITVINDYRAFKIPENHELQLIAEIKSSLLTLMAESKVPWTHDEKLTSLLNLEKLITKQVDFKRFLRHNFNTENWEHRLAEIRELEVRRNFLLEKQFNSSDGQQKISDSLASVNLKLLNSKKVLKKIFPDYTNLFETTNVFNQMDEDTDILRIYQTDSLSYAAIMNHDKLLIYSLGKTSLLRNDIHQIRNQISLNSSFEINQFELLNRLKQIVDSNFKSSKYLSIIPDGMFASLPFDLVTSKPFVSKSLIGEFSTKKQHDQLNTIAFSPSYTGETPLALRTRIRSGAYALPFAQEEALEISKLFDADYFEGGQATKQNFLQLAPKYNMHHLAMHAIVDSEKDNKALLVFNGDENEGLLNIEEVYGLNLDSELVTLSACNTAMGKKDPIEGSMSLSRAFQYAGARSTLTSLWRVPDRETSQIMKSFYNHLKNGERKDVALKMAKTEYLDSQIEEQFKQPYYWAGFVLTGDPSPVVDDGTHWVLILIGLSVLVGIILLVALSRKRKKS
ncbi:CHAT domain-containing protein [Nonlabens xiamenensis]|uniref:CHAT domain-containing protein n=1 Tax=Nonlabens xiamenensis TaxID=2341043 RepID=UPI0013DE1D87|nr:CHAT domain-containing protein [Nonlabens xiamenensis]